MLCEFGGLALKDKFAPVSAARGNGGIALGSFGAFLVIESGPMRRRAAPGRMARLAAGGFRPVNRTPGGLTRAFKRLWERDFRACVPATSPSSRARAAPRPRPRRSAHFSQHRDIAVRAPGTYVGHGFEPQFPMNVALAALAVSHGNCYPPADGLGRRRRCKAR